MKKAMSAMTMVWVILAIFIQTSCESSDENGNCPPTPYVAMSHFDVATNVATIVWDQATKANMYQVEYSNADGAFVALIVNGTSLDYLVDPEAGEHTFVVNTFCSEEVIAMGTSVSFTIQGECPPPKEVDIEIANDIIVISWEYPEGVNSAIVQSFFEGDMIDSQSTSYTAVEVPVPNGFGEMLIEIISVCGDGGGGFGTSTLILVPSEVEGACLDPTTELSGIKDVYVNKSGYSIHYKAPGFFCMGECNLGGNCK